MPIRNNERCSTFMGDSRTADLPDEVCAPRTEHAVSGGRIAA